MGSACDLWDDVVTRIVVGLLCCTSNAVFGRIIGLDLRGMREKVVLIICTLSSVCSASRYSPRKTKYRR